MADLIKDKITKALLIADTLYYRLVLLVGTTGSGKTKVLCEVADDLGANIINLNQVLSADLLEMTVTQRALRLPRLLNRIVNTEQSIVVIDNLEILFDKSLRQDPLRLLQSISRNHLIAASWNGTFADGRLVYAESGHPEYQIYDPGDILIVCMDGRSKYDFLKDNSEAEQV